MSIINRRTLLTTLAASPVALTGLGAFNAASRAQAQAAGLITPNICLMQRETTEGPFYFDPDLLRRDITEGLPGTPLALELQVVDGGCAPLGAARVDIWHCDAVGRYSGYRRTGTPGETFMRGTQIADARGVVRFDTVYPGWYPGRTTHVHYKVFVNGSEMFTGQLFFPDSISNAVHGLPAYQHDGRQGRIENGADRIARRAGDGAYAQVEPQGSGYVARLVAGLT